MEKKAVYITLGCKLNFAETSSLGDKLEAAGVGRAAHGEHADVCVVNTCTVTETSSHKCRQAINRAVRENPDALMVVMGCYAQMAADEIAAMPGVDLVIDMEHKGRAAEMIIERLQESRGESQEASGLNVILSNAKNLTEVLSSESSFGRSARSG